MARWRLKEKHYLNVPGTEWQYTEQSPTTGKQVRKTYIVPRFLDPADHEDWTEIRYANNGQPMGGEINVCYEGKGGPRDIIFVGDPTPDMEPLDPEAQEISARFAKRWVHPIESLPGSFGESILNDLQRQIDAIAKEPPANKALPGVSQEDFTKMQEQVAALMEQNKTLMEQLVEKSARRI